MKIIVIGLGSMGKRRIRLLSDHKYIELFGIDSQESRCQEVKEKFGIKCYESIAAAVAAALSHSSWPRTCFHVSTKALLARCSPSSKSGLWQ